MNKRQARKRRSVKAKAIIQKSKRARLVVFRSNNHLYSQIIVTGEHGDVILTAASSVDKELKASLSGNKCDQAREVGKILAKRAKDKNLSEVAFDRSGYKYHGRVRALAEGAREAGLVF